jgi:hypothetical protein
MCNKLYKYLILYILISKFVTRKEVLKLLGVHYTRQYDVSTDNLKLLLVTFIFGTTVYHELVGAILMSLYRHPWIVASTLRDNGLSHYDTQPYSHEVCMANVALFSTACDGLLLNRNFSSDIADDENIKKKDKTKVWGCVDNY